MHVFYIPDGHRRYAMLRGCTLVDAYKLGYKVLLDEVLIPLLKHPKVNEVSVFLLSVLNLRRRADDELAVLLNEGDVLLDAMLKSLAPLASIRTFGTYLPQNLRLGSESQRRLNLFIGSAIDDRPDCGEADLFFRSGGELRLSGAPRALLGDYTQLYVLDTLHPELRFPDVEALIDRYAQRYMRTTDGAWTPSKSC